MIPSLCLAVALSGGVAVAQDLPAPSPPARPDPYTPADPPDFGSDVAVGYALGALMGSWPDAGPWGSVLARTEAFLVSRDQPGPRLGLGLWGSATVGPRQRFVEDDGRTGRFSATGYGVMTVLRGEPSARISPMAGLGFGRIDLVDYHQGPLAIPTLTFEGGARAGVRGPLFVDLAARAHWGTTRSPTAESLHEWWGVQLLLTPGLHIR
jgi:hypothetical protein